MGRKFYPEQYNSDGTKKENVLSLEQPQIQQYLKNRFNRKSTVCTA